MMVITVKLEQKKHLKIHLVNEWIFLKGEVAQGVIQG
jgi:hypothetical protein